MDDLISRQAAINTLAEMHCKSDEDGYVWIIRSDAWARIDALPSVERKKGKWILTDFPDEQTYKCSACGEYWAFIEGNPTENGAYFCPNCGADMRGEGYGE